jgi:ADP-ribose pyrophosphatase
MPRSVRPKPKIDARRRVLDGYLKVDELTISFDRFAGDGRIEGQRRLVLERGDSAGVLIHDIESDSVLLTEQVRAPTITKGPGVIREVVAGSVEPSETAADCIRRELEEEIGYRVPRSALKRIGTFYLSPGGSSERLTLFYAGVKASQRVNPKARGVAAEGEDIAMVAVKRADLVRRALAGRIDDAKTMIAALWLAAQRPSSG